MMAEEGREPRRTSAWAGLVQTLVDANKPADGADGADHVICGHDHHDHHYDGMSPLPVSVAHHNIENKDAHLVAQLTTVLPQEVPLTTADGDNSDSPTTSFDGSDQGLRNRREMFSGVKKDGSTSTSTGTGMRQESYYLRGVVEAERDERLLCIINDCIPGDQTVAVIFILSLEMCRRVP